MNAGNSGRVPIETTTYVNIGGCLCHGAAEGPHCVLIQPRYATDIMAVAVAGICAILWLCHRQRPKS